MLKVRAVEGPALDSADGRAPPIQYCRTDDGVSIAYSTLGEGSTVIATESGVFSHLALEWDVPGIRRYFERLAESFQVVRYAARGRALSAGGSIGHDAQAADLVAVTDAVGGKSVAMVSSSTGIMQAVAFANRFPERVRCIVSLGPTLGMSSAATQVVGTIQKQMHNRGEVLAALLDPERIDPPGPLARMIKEIRPPDDVMERTRPMAESFAPEELPRLRVPLLVVHWPETSFSEGPALASLVPGAQLVTRAGKGHFWYDPDPDSLIALIRDFVMEHADPTAQTWDQPEPVAETAGAKTQAPHKLSPRELEVLRLIADGKSNPQIAGALVIAPGTVGRHVSNLLAKTGLSNRAELTRYAVEHGLTGD